MESIYLKTFIEVIAAGSFSKAADTLCVTQSAVSRRIKFLEEQYDCELIDRTGPVLIPTSHGRLVLEKAQKLMEIERELLVGLKSLGDDKTISCGCTPAFGIAYLPAILKEFMLQNADLNNLKFIFDMPEAIVKGLRENIYDLAVVEHCQCFDLSEFRTWSLSRDDMVFISSPTLNLAAPEADIEALTSHHLYSRKEGCCSYEFLKKNMERVGRSLNDFEKIIIFDDLHLIIRAVTAGEGIAFISRSLVTKELEEGLLCGHLVSGFLHEKNRTLAVVEESLRDPVVKNFLDCLFKFSELAATPAVITCPEPTPR
jgi:DNA-binding transcriptional LysR family regulator